MKNLHIALDHRVIPPDLKGMRQWNFLGRLNEEIPMKKTRFTEAQIMGVLRQMEGAVPAAKLCREHGMSSATLYKWRAKYGGMDASLISEMKAMWTCHVFVPLRLLV